MTRPLYVYDNWSAYDELSDNVLLAEELAMRQFNEILRLRSSGMQIDAYLMDAFWYSRSGGYRTWKPDRWPHGPDVWLAACDRAGLVPGLWFPANTAFQLEPPESWRDSLASNDYGFCCFEGGFMAGFIDVLSHWYEKGVRVFKFDFAELNAVPKGKSVPDARQRNAIAFRQALGEFRTRCPGAYLLAYNGFEDAEYMPWTDRPLRPVFDRSWLQVFDTVYCGDPRPAGVPLPNFWRSLDVYADAEVHLLHRGGLALEEIDNCAFMIGLCGTCYRRGSADWKSTALLSYARGGRVHLVMGNMEGLSDEDAAWLGRVQKLYETAGTPSWVGGNPGQEELFAYAAAGVVTVVNPSLTEKSLTLGEEFRIIYADGRASWSDGTVTLGCGAVAVLAVGGEDLGRIPPAFGELTEIHAAWEVGPGYATGALSVPAGSGLHLVFRQRGEADLLINTSGGSPPDGTSSAKLLRISASQSGRELRVNRPDDKVAWSGLSWAYGIVSASDLSPDEPVTVRFDTDEKLAVSIEAKAFAEQN